MSIAIASFIIKSIAIFIYLDLVSSTDSEWKLVLVQTKDAG